MPSILSIMNPSHSSSSSGPSSISHSAPSSSSTTYAYDTDMVVREDGRMTVPMLNSNSSGSGSGSGSYMNGVTVNGGGGGSQRHQHPTQLQLHYHHLQQYQQQQAAAAGLNGGGGSQLGSPGAEPSPASSYPSSSSYYGSTSMSGPSSSTPSNASSLPTTLSSYGGCANGVGPSVSGVGMSNSASSGGGGASPPQAFTPASLPSLSRSHSQSQSRHHHSHHPSNHAHSHSQSHSQAASGSHLRSRSHSQHVPSSHHHSSSYYLYQQQLQQQHQQQQQQVPIPQQPPPQPSYPHVNPYTEPPPPLPLPPLEPRHYTILKEVGDGSFGTVWLADWHSKLDIPAGTNPPGPSSRPEYRGKRLVAVKRMKKAFEGGWDECLKLKELKSLRTIPMHPNLIPLYDAYLLPSTKELYFVFECMEGNLYQLTKTRKGRPLAGGLVASLFYQILAGLHHIHISGFFHRDMKPENLLITTTGIADYPPSSPYALPGTPPEKDVTVIVKLADFGLARETKSKPPYTEYVSTRWYRAPEVLLRSRDYSNPVDMWALGTILAEIVTLKPLFPGQSEMDQVFKIVELLGNPSRDYGTDERGRIKGGGPWDKGIKMAKSVGFQFPKMRPMNFTAQFDPLTVPYQLIDCMADLMRYEPKSRLTTQQCFDHPYFQEVAPRLQPIMPPSAYAPPQPSLQQSTPSPNRTGGSQPQAFDMDPSPRSLPPSHSHGTPGHLKPVFGADHQQQQARLQAQAQAMASQMPPSSQYQQSSSSGSYPNQLSPHQQPSEHAFSGSGHSRHLSVPESAMTVSDPDSHGMGSYPIMLATSSQPMSYEGQAGSPGVGSGSGHHSHGASSSPRVDFPSPVPSSLYSCTPQFMDRMPVIPEAPNHRNNSPTASTFYDGSIFEGIAPTRQSSIMSFPVGYGSEEQAPPPNFSSPPQAFAAIAHQPLVPIPKDRQRTVYDDELTLELQRRQQAEQQRYLAEQYHHQQQQQQHQQIPSHPTAAESSSASGGSNHQQQASITSKSRAWNFVSVFNHDHKNSISGGGATATAPSMSWSSSLRRTPSQNTGNMLAEATGQSPADSKKAKKEAEKAAKQEEKAKRELAARLQRERARAVMQKRQQQASGMNHDPLHMDPTPQVPAPSQQQHSRPSVSPSTTSTPPRIDKGKGKQRMPGERATGPLSPKLPQIMEDPGHLSVSDPRFRPRRMESDEEVHSVSSNETRGSGGQDPRFSLSSDNTLDSDPGPQTQRSTRMPIQRAVSIQSLQSVSRQNANAPYHGNDPTSRRSSSSLDSQLVNNMRGLATEGGWSSRGSTGGGTSPRRSQRSPSPATSIESPRYSPYPHPSARPSQHQHHNHATLPPVQHHPHNHNRHLSTISQSSSGAHSYHSMPSALPSHYDHNMAIQEEESGATGEMYEPPQPPSSQPNGYPYGMVQGSPQSLPPWAGSLPNQPGGEHQPMMTTTSASGSWHPGMIPPILLPPSDEDIALGTHGHMEHIQPGYGQ